MLGAIPTSTIEAELAAILAIASALVVGITSLVLLMIREVKAIRAAWFTSTQVLTTGQTTLAAKVDTLAAESASAHGQILEAVHNGTDHSGPAAATH